MQLLEFERLSILALKDNYIAMYISKNLILTQPKLKGEPIGPRLGRIIATMPI
jgi:hypothetical protein